MDNDFILVLDLGGPEAIEMARKLRNQRYYTEIMSRSADIELFRRKAPRGILVVGGENRYNRFPKPVLELGVPVLALGSAARKMIEACGAKSGGVLLKDQASQITFMSCPLFDTLCLKKLSSHLKKLNTFFQFCFDLLNGNFNFFPWYNIM